MKPKKIYRKDGCSVDYVFDTPDFEDNYMVGCVIKRTDKKTIVRVTGKVSDLANVVLKREGEFRRMIENMKYKGDITKFKHIATIHDCRNPEENIWFIRTQVLNDILKKI